MKATACARTASPYDTFVQGNERDLAKNRWFQSIPDAKWPEFGHSPASGICIIHKCPVQAFASLSASFEQTVESTESGDFLPNPAAFPARTTVIAHFADASIAAPTHDRSNHVLAG